MSVGGRQIVFQEDNLSGWKRLIWVAMLDFWHFDRGLLLYVKESHGMLIAIFVLTDWQWTNKKWR